MLGWTTERFLTDAHAQEPEGFAPQYETLVARRATREPLAYIVGVREFWGLELEVTPHVLIPRPATELIVEAMLELFRDRAAPLAVADICTGCGCVAVAIAHERPAATVVATDISPEALEVARRNAVAPRRRRPRRRSATATSSSGIDRRLDAIVANPPYVVDRAAPALQPEVRDYEPAVALFGGSEGFDLVTRLVAEAPSRLRPGGYLVFEFGLGQDVEVEELLEQRAGPDAARDCGATSRASRAPRSRSGADRRRTEREPFRRAAVARLTPSRYIRIEPPWPTASSARSSTREIPASIVYEDDRVLAFNDINPQGPTHVLVVPKRHIATLNDLTPDDDQIVGELVRRAAAIAARARHRGRRLPDRLQHQSRRRPDRLPHPPAPDRRPQPRLAARLTRAGHGPSNSRRSADL